VGDSIWPAIGLVVVAVVLVGLRVVMWRGARSLGERARQRKMERTGKGPAGSA
jgi:hypothetical protein